MQTLKTQLLQPLRLALVHDQPGHRSMSLVGAILGLVLFLFVGLLPSLLLGGSAGAQLAGGLLGEQVSPSYGLNALLVLSVVIATTMGAAFFTVLGAAAGAAVSELTGLRVARKAAP
jgi:hypothetical protein